METPASQSADVFVVARDGVYRKEIGSVHSDQAAAVAAAGLYIRAEPDDYHHYLVLRFQLDAAAAPVAAVLRGVSPIDDDPMLVARVTRDDGSGGRLLRYGITLHRRAYAKSVFVETWENGLRVCSSEEAL